MSVAEIKEAVSKLSFSERAEFARWFHGLTDDDWDREMAADFGPEGRYEHVLRDVEENIRKGHLRDLPICSSRREEALKSIFI